MANDEVKYGYALLDNSEKTISIDDIDRSFSQQHKFFCPHCRREMYATFGLVQTPHFRHNGEKCQHSQYLHALAEMVFLEEYTKCLENGLPFYLELLIPRPCNKACVLEKHRDCKEHYIKKIVDLTQEYTHISIETRVDIEDSRYRRPDILLEAPDGRQLWIEIWVSHETEEKKRNDGRIIEIKIKREKDIETIKQHKIVQSEENESDVRIFNIESDGEDFLFADDTTELEISYPCEKYYCFEYGSHGKHTEFIDSIKKNTRSDLQYRIILRLNWAGCHNSPLGSAVKHYHQDAILNYCLQRYSTYSRSWQAYLDKTFDSLIVFETYEPKPHKATKPRLLPSLSTPNQQKPEIEATPFDIDFMDWVDLGLPSHTLWAQEDIQDKMIFDKALQLYGTNIPSYDNAQELLKYCVMEWDASGHTLILTGPNGNTLSFPCKEHTKSYWLNTRIPGAWDYCECFHITHDWKFTINDKESSSIINIRLVKRAK